MRRSGAGLATAGVAATMATLGVVPATALAAWTAPADLSASGQNARAASLAVDAAGDAVFAWRRFDGTNDRIQAQTRSAAGVLGPVRTLSAAGQPAFGNQVAIDGAGNAVITWLRNDGAFDIAQARRVSAAGVVGPTLNLAPAGQDAVIRTSRSTSPATRSSHGVAGTARTTASTRARSRRRASWGRC